MKRDLLHKLRLLQFLANERAESVVNKEWVECQPIFYCSDSSNSLYAGNSTLTCRWQGLTNYTLATAHFRFATCDLAHCQV